MAVYSFHRVLVWDRLGNAVHVARNVRVEAVDPNTGTTPAGLTQDGRAVTFLTSDSAGLVEFEANVPTVELTAPNRLVQRVTSQDAIESAAGFTVSEDAAIAGSINTPGSASRAAVEARVGAGTAGKADKTYVDAGLAGKASSVALAAAQGQIDSLTQVAATVDELSASTIISAWVYAGASVPSLPASQAMSVWVAPFPCRITALWVSWEYYNLATSDTDYWAVTGRRMRGAESLGFVSRNTKTAGGAAIAGRTPWSFAAATWDVPISTFAAGDILILNPAKTGAPTDMLLPITVSWRYRPL